MSEERKRLGSLWVATDKNGNKYFKGSLESPAGRIPVVAFKNKNKSGETSPDFIIWESKPYEKGAKPKPPPKEEDWM